MHLRDVGREAKILGDVRVVLRRVVAVRDEADAEVFAGLQLAGLVDVVANLFDVLRRRCDVAALAARAVLHEDEVAVWGR